MIPAQFTQYFRDIELPLPNSHKGQNGKVMVIGGSELFHAASQWALTVVSRMVDMVFYSSIPSNNQLVHEAKKHFHNGIVIPRTEIESYIEEAEVVLIGPGMERSISLSLAGRDQERVENKKVEKPTKEDWEHNTEAVTNYLLSKYPNKKWVIDAGALQMVDPNLLNKNCIITPHQEEFRKIYRKRVMQLTEIKPDGSYLTTFEGETSETSANWKAEYSLWFEDSILESLADYSNLDKGQIHNFKNHFIHSSKLLHGTTILTKGVVDAAVRWTGNYDTSQLEIIKGGNQGMTKGGTGDVLAGLVAGLYCFTDNPFSAAVVGSYVNKKAGDELYEKVGPFFNASDLADQIPKTLHRILTH